MMKKEFHLHSGQKGAALAIHVIPRARKNEIVEISHDGAIKIRLKSPADSDHLNADLLTFLAKVLGVSRKNVEIVGGMSTLSKLVSILEMNAKEAHIKILENLS